MTPKLLQTSVVTMANLKSLHRRVWISLSMILSVMLVVVVLVGFLAMARGFETALEGAGSDDVAILLAGGGRDEQGSSIPPALLDTAQSIPSEYGVVRSADGPLISAELVVPVDARLKDGGDIQTLSLRGMQQTGVELRSLVTLKEGRLARRGAAELVVGADVARRYAGFGIGADVSFGVGTWTVVGHFEARGSAFESEIWSDLSTVQTLFRREGEIQTLRIGLRTPWGADALTGYFADVSAVPVTILTEKDFYSGQSRRVSQIIRLFGWPVALLMAIGAVAGALNTMLSSVSDRSVEIATLRAVGFSRTATFIGTWTEALLLTVVGAGVGAAVSVLLFNGWEASTRAAGSGQIGFDLQVSWNVVFQAWMLALIIGVIGGALPALRAARMPIIRAMRGTA